MQGFRVFNDVRQVGIEINVLGYRVRTLSISFLLLGVLSLAAGIVSKFTPTVILGVGLFIVFSVIGLGTTIAARWLDPTRTESEWTLWSGLYRTIRTPYISNTGFGDESVQPPKSALTGFGAHMEQPPHTVLTPRRED